MAEWTDESMRGDERPLGRADQDADQDAADAETAAIRAEIRDTRERMGDTIEEIGERLNPRHLKEQVKHDIREATIGRVENMAQSAADRVSRTRRTITDTVRENPIPAAMIGIGLGWLIWSGRTQGRQSFRTASRYGYAAGPPYPSGVAGAVYTGGADDEPGAMERVRERAGEIGGEVKDKAGELADQAQEAVGQVATRAQDAAGAVAEQTRYQARRVQDQFYESPLAVGAATLALGLAAGLAIPATRKEAELMGGARDQLVDRVREVAQETKDKVQHVAERVVDQAQTTGKEAAREEGLTS